ncbi:enoyl-CoA hydratase-related protein [Alloalcanivorax xenomutans]|jgi:2-(1,2-epoxy-1,2-dihydrophenyl)acetyl-CoA isomerase|uniref:Enoyl-CoA hydratase-related protein n=1 Tax=Alloalcanivorax xenomutans TaxID=1094342 RepID=A0A9Q3W2F6_9GAMM|nr:enoyl-CoA hydratase-related protein [Alloalcanivorax xenomutans]MCE7508046.1 enoyl-CoA hydratase-related protein [Alloalcanivorax xenomutans]MCE7523301.1 enoyl-CoA hydratase-related protein [Alloalcanivorax xenomutans]
MEYNSIQLQRDGAIAMLSLHRPKTMNALATELQKEMLHALAAIEQDDSVRALIVTGSGRAFCSGADLGTMAPASDESVGTRVARMMRETSVPLIQALRRCRVPVVSAVNGAAAGAGASLALAGDVVVAARSAYFLFPFIPTLGILPDLGATWHLPRLAGSARAMGATLLGERIPSEQAERWGMIWGCCDDEALEKTSRELATRLAALPRGAALEARRALDAAQHNTLDQQMELETQGQQRLIDSDAFQEGVQAFLEKRRPNFD